MATVITLQNLQDWVLFPSAGVAAAVNLLETATPIASITAAEVGAWGNAVQWTLTHGAGATWDLQLEAMGMVQTFTGLDTSIGTDNTASVQPTTTYNERTVSQPAWVTLAKLADGRPDEDIGLLTGGDNVRAGLDLHVLVQRADRLIAASPAFYERNPGVQPLVRGYLATLDPPQTEWSALDQTERDTFLAALLAAIDD